MRTVKHERRVKQYDELVEANPKMIYRKRAGPYDMMWEESVVR